MPGHRGTQCMVCGSNRQLPSRKLASRKILLGFEASGSRGPNVWSRSSAIWEERRDAQPLHHPRGLEPTS